MAGSGLTLVASVLGRPGAISVDFSPVLQASRAEGPELKVRLGQPLAAFGPRVGQHRGGVQILDPAGPGELIGQVGPGLPLRVSA
jgi:hypothetical protein